MDYMIKIPQKIRRSHWFLRGIATFFLQFFMLAALSHAAAPVISNPATGTTLPSVAVGQSMSIPISSTGGQLPLDKWVQCDARDPDYDGVTPCLPPGLVLAPSPGSATTTLYGAPTTAGTYTFSITLTDGLNQGGVATYTLVVTSSAMPTLTSTTPNSGSTAGGTSVTLTGTNLTGATAVSFGGTAASGYIVNNASTITATTPAHAAGAVSVVVTTPGGTATLSNAYTYNVPAPVAGDVSVTVAVNSSANPITLNFSGGAAASVAVASAASHGTATASGTSITYTPAAGYSGSDSFTYTATNVTGTSSPATVFITVSAPTVAITTPSLPNGTVGSIYSTTLSASGGTAPYTYSITSGSLPAGLSLNTSTGVISGTPSSSSTANLTVTATDTNSATGSRAYSLAVTAPVAETVPLPGNAGNASVLVTSTQAGCTVSPGTLRISASGIPSAPANASFPVGALFFSTTGCAGAKLQVQVDYPAGSLAGLTMQKYGPHGQPPMQIGWFTPPDLAVNGNSVSYSVTDDGEGDNETTVPGVITDPFGPMLLAAPAGSHAIPTISEWGLIVLSALMSIFGLARMRRRQV